MSKTPQSPTALNRPALFKALGDPVRLALLSTFIGQDKPFKVGELTQCCGIDLSGISRHLKILHEAGILSSEKKGRTVEYRLDAKSLGEDFRQMAEILDPQ
jgi:ArsR family transcriptional regulator